MMLIDGVVTVEERGRGHDADGALLGLRVRPTRSDAELIGFPRPVRSAPARLAARVAVLLDLVAQRRELADPRVEFARDAARAARRGARASRAVEPPIA